MPEPTLQPEAAYAAIVELVARGGWLGLDTETTGIEVHDQVVDLAIVTADGQVLFESLARTSLPIHPGAFAKSGIQADGLKCAPEWPEVWRRAADLLAGREVVAFNAEFDSGAIAQTCSAHSLAPIPVRWICAQRLLSPLWSREKVSLRRVCQDLAIEPGTHRAASDAVAMVRALRAVAERPMVVRIREIRGAG